MRTVDGVCRDGYAEAGVDHSCDPQPMEDLHVVSYLHSNIIRRLAHGHRALSLLARSIQRSPTPQPEWTHLGNHGSSFPSQNTYVACIRSP